MGPTQIIVAGVSFEIPSALAQSVYELRCKLDDEGSARVDEILREEGVNAALEFLRATVVSM
jgi:hypothetical protein